MAKKRTLVPFYGKLNQQYDALAAQALKANQPKVAEELNAKSREVYKKRRGY